MMATQTYTAGEIAENNGKNGKPIWMIVKGAVYDLTNFAKDHPGGDEAILEYAGKDGTKAFNDVGHSADAIKEMKLYKIGVVDTSNVITKQSSKTPVLRKDLDRDAQPSTAGQKKKRMKLFFCF